MDTLSLFLPSPSLAVIPVLAWVAISAAGLVGTAWFGSKAIDDSADALDKFTDAATKLSVFALGGWLIYLKIKRKKK